MIPFFSWYLILSILGWLTFPLVYWLFPALADRGFSLSRTAGLLIWGYVFWLLNSLGLIQNNIGGILFGLLALIGISTAVFLKRKSEILNYLRSNLRLVVTIEILFLAAFALLAMLRAGNPELDNAEKPMELMFINAILRSPGFPPHDSWLSGYAISYYYFGYVMAAMLAMLTGLTGSVAHNLMTALVFALAAIGAYGILYTLLTKRESEIVNRESDNPRLPTHDSRITLLSFLAPLFLLVVSNIEGFLEVLHRTGIFWLGTKNFWTWLGIKELSDPPTQPLGWIPDRFWWWWRASRVVSDYDLAGNFREVIDEFPFFSFLHADLHPHVLAIPFNLLAIAIALNIFLGGWRGETKLFGIRETPLWGRLQIHKVGFFAAALTLGGLAFLNTWDILVAAALIVLAYVLYRVRVEGWSWSRLEDVFVLGLPLGLLSILLYLPFYFGFSSQAGGILPNLTDPTRGAQLWVMFMPLFIPLLAFLMYLWRSEKQAGNSSHKTRGWLTALLLVVSLTIFLWALSWTLGWLALLKDPVFTQQFLASQHVPGVAAFFNAAMFRRLSYIGGLLTLLAILTPALFFLLQWRKSEKEAEIQESEIGHGSPSTVNRQPSIVNGQPLAFILLLIILGSLLVLAPDFVYLRDQFETRLNTIFKFYYQAWLLWSLAAAFGVAVLLRELRGVSASLFNIALIIVLFLSLTYPALSIANKTNNFNPYLGWTLDDFNRIRRNYPDDAAAILWLKSAPDGVVAEAVGAQGGSYTGYARISEYTGLPTVLGWVGHESQWRGTMAPQGTRQDDIALLYTAPNWEPARDILNKYGIRYVYIGDLERSTYAVQEDKFQRNLVRVFQKGSVTIYQVP
jgi:YYY domain-containing protein